jgi:light-regulated signal transduction histidine kinase (bacteriophytochrome)
MSDGATIAVWVTGTTILGGDGRIRHIRCVAQDITAKRTLEAELQVKNERLALANTELSRKNKELDEFTYVVSHDLQEPLRTLIAFSDFLMRDQGDKLDDAGKEYVRYLVEASRRLRSLIQDLLSLSRAGKVTAEFSSVNLDEVVEVLKADLSELVRSRNAAILVESPLPEIWGDRDRIGQLLANLVGNGLKYNQNRDPKVEISAREDPEGRWVTLSVKDNGIGIEPQFHARIFQLFRRLHTREEYDGTGAGLAICQKIVQAHGGRIWVESEPGQGSTFHVMLPASPEATPARRVEILHAS